MQTIVVVGAGLAGQRAVESLRKLGFSGRLVLVGEEKERPYDRPPLSKKLLRGFIDESSIYFRDPHFYEAEKIEFRGGVCAQKLDLHSRCVELSDGSRERFDCLLIATGARPRRLSCPGSNLEGVYVLRSLEDARAIREELKPGKRVVLIGGGVIGLEVAASCKEEGLEVTVLEASEAPCIRAFGREVGQLLARFHRKRGVDLRTCVQVLRLLGQKKVHAVELQSGEVVPCDFVVVGIGVDPATEWLSGSGLVTEGVVRVSPNCSTALSGIYAAGDVASYYHPRFEGWLRPESVENAQLMASTAVAHMLGQNPIHAPVPWFWSDQFDLKIQAVGLVNNCDRIVFRGSIEEERFVAFLLKGDRLQGAVGIGRLKEIGGAKKLIAEGIPVSDTLLADPDVPLSTFWKGHSP
ncbi:MAG: FAD-dependent oxidoreductase [Sandaracinaceae bacterium]|nr:FAD-dependent oxidoreductase [Sandaracinaceae bacterium]